VKRAACLAVAFILHAAPARADEERVTLTLRGAAFDREDGGYADHAAVFGLDRAEVGGGGVVEAGARVLPRLWLYASWSGFTSLAARRLSQLRVSNQVLLAQAGWTAFRRDALFRDALVPLSLRVDVLAGGGLYRLSDELDGMSRSVSGPGMRAGGQVTLSWRAIGFVVAGGWHLARARLVDRAGGELEAGGVEFGAGLALRY
jgi:hypothetical protein